MGEQAEDEEWAWDHVLRRSLGYSNVQKFVPPLFLFLFLFLLCVCV